MSKQEIRICGLGGQGVIKASDMLAMACFKAGHDVKKAEVHGVSQRGGSVTSDVRFGEHVLSPMVPAGEADYLVVLDETQFEPVKRRLSEQGVVLRAGMVDPDKLPNPKALNVVLLGMLSVYLDISEDVWLDAIHHYLPERLHEMNNTAFALGRSLVEQ